jgi:hypothetical protein
MYKQACYWEEIRGEPLNKAKMYFVLLFITLAAFLGTRFVLVES